MATTIKLKNGSGAPLAGDLVQGEPALDLTNKRLYTEDSGGSVIEVGTNPTSLTTGTFTSTGIDDNAASTAITIDSSQDVTFTSDAKFPDNGKALFGADSDLQIYHNGSNSVVRETGSGSLYLGTNNQIVMYDTSNSEELAVFNRDGDVQLNYNNVTRLATTSTGIDVNGAIDSPVLNIKAAYGSSQERYGAIKFENTSYVGANSEIRNIANGSSYIGSALGFFTSQNASGTLTQRMTIDRYGNVGIGTDSPSYKLDVIGSARVKTGATATPFIVSTGGDAQGTIRFGSASAEYSINGGADYLSLRFNTNSAERMRIASSGNVGINESSPTSLLSVTRGAGAGLARSSSALAVDSDSAISTEILITGTDTHAGQVRFGNTTSTFRGAFNYDHPNDFLSTIVNGSERMRIDSSGNVMVGSTTAQASDAVTLLPDGEVTASGFYFANNIGSPMNSEGIRRPTTGAIAFDTGSTERMRISSGGNLLVGKTASGESIASGPGHVFVPGETGFKSHVQTGSGTTNYMCYYNRASTGGGFVKFSYNDSEIGSITTNGSTTSYNPSSDERLKENIRDYDNALADVMKLKPRKYSWKANGAEDNGFIAQELLETPEFSNRVNPIGEDADPVYGVDYMKFVAVLTGAIQEQQAMIEELKAEVAALKGA